MIREGKIVVYMDDILLAHSNLDEHFEILTEVLQRMNKNKLELNFAKCKFLQEEITYLGYKVTSK